MRTSLLAGMTTRGTSFLAAGAASALAGYLLGERGLFCVGIALLALPLLAAAAIRRAQYRLGTSRAISPPRVPAGHTATVTLRLENVSRVATGLLLAEDTVPYALGTRPRYVLDKIERNGFAGADLFAPLRLAGQVRDRAAAAASGGFFRARRAIPLAVRADQLRCHAAGSAAA